MFCEKTIDTGLNILNRNLQRISSTPEEDYEKYALSL